MIPKNTARRYSFGSVKREQVAVLVVFCPPPMRSHFARILFPFASCVTSAKPSASINGGR